MRRNSTRKKLVDRIVGGLVNVLGIIYTDFYFPTYTNGLKEISGVLGCTWSDEHASGIQSILWRRHWETNRDEMWKALLTYNKEDCTALRTSRSFCRHWQTVLISDFYAAHDAIACPQQKCLIHLMRDLNQALLASPVDDEVHALTQPFGTLLREIVTTVDEYDPKRYRLARHQKGVAEFFTQIRARNVRSEAAQTIRDRLLKYQDKLFTFIQLSNMT